MKLSSLNIDKLAEVISGPFAEAQFSKPVVSVVKCEIVSMVFESALYEKEITLTLYVGSNSVLLTVIPNNEEVPTSEAKFLLHTAHKRLCDIFVLPSHPDAQYGSALGKNGFIKAWLMEPSGTIDGYIKIADTFKEPCGSEPVKSYIDGLIDHIAVISENGEPEVEEVTFTLDWDIQLDDYLEEIDDDTKKALGMLKGGYITEINTDTDFISIGTLEGSCFIRLINTTTGEYVPIKHCNVLPNIFDCGVTSFKLLFNGEVCLTGGIVFSARCEHDSAGVRIGWEIPAGSKLKLVSAFILDTD